MILSISASVCLLERVDVTIELLCSCVTVPLYEALSTLSICLSYVFYLLKIEELYGKSNWMKGFCLQSPN